MKIVVTFDETVYVPDYCWFERGRNRVTQIGEWKAETNGVEEIEPLTDFDLEDFSGATEQEFGR